MIFSRHLYFIDFSKYGCNIPYFNIVSENEILFSSEKEVNFME